VPKADPIKVPCGVLRGNVLAILINVILKERAVVRPLFLRAVSDAIFERFDLGLSAALVPRGDFPYGTIIFVAAKKSFSPVRPPLRYAPTYFSVDV